MAKSRPSAHRGNFEETYALLRQELVFGGSAVPSFHTDALIFERRARLESVRSATVRRAKYDSWLPTRTWSRHRPVWLRLAFAPRGRIVLRTS